MGMKDSCGNKFDQINKKLRELNIEEVDEYDVGKHFIEYPYLPGPTHIFNEPCLPNHSVVGRCSICGGSVTVPTIWGGVVPPVPTCSSCGATMQPNYGRTLPMTPARPHRYTVATNVSDLWKKDNGN